MQSPGPGAGLGTRLPPWDPVVPHPQWPGTCRASELGRTLGNLREWVWRDGRESKFVFFLMGATELEMRWGRLVFWELT